MPKNTLVSNNDISSGVILIESAQVRVVEVRIGWSYVLHILTWKMKWKRQSGR